MGENNSYIGCLHSGGLNALPLISLKEGDNTVIDLSTLTLDGTNVIPANNPIGDEIKLNQDEIERYQQLGAFYESLSYNIDADNDGIVSVSVEYKDMSGRSINPENFVYQSMVQLNDIYHNQLCNIGTLWENPEAKTNTELYTFIPQKTIQVSALHSITVCYLDLLGNAYNIGFNK